MTTIDTLLSRVSPLTETECIMLASECEMLLKRAKLCAGASAANSRYMKDYWSIVDSIQSALDNMPSIENWEEAQRIYELTGDEA